MYKVLKAFTDDTDGRHIYHAGDTYPRPGAAEPTEERIAYLMGDNNRFGRPLIHETSKGKRKKSGGE